MKGMRMSEPNFKATNYGQKLALQIEQEAADWRVSTWDIDNPPLATEEQVPILDLSDCIEGRDGALDAFVEKLRIAAFGTGFYLLKGHGVPTDLEAAAHKQGIRFKELAEQTKLHYAQNANGVGYVPLNVRRQPRREKGNMCECIYFKRELGSRDITWDKNQWPVELGREFRDTLVEYWEAMERLAKRLLPAYARLLGVKDNFFDDAFEGGLLRSRLGYYPLVPLEDNQYGVSPHVDTTFLTILSRFEQIPGLRACTVDGHWLTIPNIEGHFAVNAGQLLKQWTNDRVVATRHYANASGEARYAIPFFWHPRADYVMDPADFPSCVNEENPSKYPPFSYLSSQGPAQGE
jgi:isopenicillin N synthase-like dioxygenase